MVAIPKNKLRLVKPSSGRTANPVPDKWRKVTQPSTVPPGTSTLARWAPPTLRDSYAARQPLFTGNKSPKSEANPWMARLHELARYEQNILHKLLTHADMEKVWVAVGKDLTGLEEEFFSRCLESLRFHGQKTKKQEKNTQTKLVETLLEAVRQLNAMGINPSIREVLPDFSIQKKPSVPPVPLGVIVAREGILGTLKPRVSEFMDALVQYLEHRWQMDADLIIKIRKPALSTAPRTYCACFITRYLLQTCGKPFPEIVLHTVNVLFEDANLTTEPLTLQQVKTITEPITKRFR